MPGWLSWVGHPWVVRLARIGIGLIFIVAGLSKLGDLKSFSDQIHNFRLIPVFAENFLAITLPWIEILAGLGLIANLRARASAWIVAVLMVIFTVAVAQAYVRGLDIECGCFGTSDASRVGLKKLGENILMTAMGFVATLPLRSGAQAPSTDPSHRTDLPSAQPSRSRG